MNDDNPLDQTHLFSGWNFIGITSKMFRGGGETEFDLELRSLVGTCNITKAYFWNSEEQVWGIFPLDEDFSTDALGSGILLKVLDDCKMGVIENYLTHPVFPN